MIILDHGGALRTEPQRRAALRGAATQRAWRNHVIGRNASTKGCSQRSSDCFTAATHAHARGLNEGLLSEEQRRGAAQETPTSVPCLNACCCGTDAAWLSRFMARPIARGLNEGLLSEEQRRAIAELDREISKGLNEGLLSEEQRPSKLPSGDRSTRPDGRDNRADEATPHAVQCCLCLGVAPHRKH